MPSLSLDGGQLSDLGADCPGVLWFLNSTPYTLQFLSHLGFFPIKVSVPILIPTFLPNWTSLCPSPGERA